MCVDKFGRTKCSSCENTGFRVSNGERVFDVENSRIINVSTPKRRCDAVSLSYIKNHSVTSSLDKEGSIIYDFKNVRLCRIGMAQADGDAVNLHTFSNALYNFFLYLRLFTPAQARLNMKGPDEMFKYFNSDMMSEFYKSTPSGVALATSPYDFKKWFMKSYAE